MGVCGCVTNHSSEAASGCCAQEGVYNGLCFYHLKMLCGYIEPGTGTSRKGVFVIVTHRDHGAIFPNPPYQAAAQALFA